jgi:hypothetical protein
MFQIETGTLNGRARRQRVREERSSNEREKQYNERCRRSLNGMMLRSDTMDWLNITRASDRAAADWETVVLDWTDETTKTTRKLIHAFQDGLWALHVESEWPTVTDIRQPKRMLAENKSRPLWPPPDDDPFETKPRPPFFSTS